ncbi:MAG: hypothetical protein ACI3XQ_00310 [Eubacteriales bacterium]
MNHLIRKAKENAAKCMDIDFCVEQYYKFSQRSSDSNVLSDDCIVFSEISDIWYDRYMELVHKS